MTILSDNIEKKVIVITGASSGLGKATAEYLHKHGARIILGARREERLRQIALDLSIPVEATVRTDVTHYNSVKYLIDRAIDLYGHVDVLLNNAGVISLGDLSQQDISEWEQMIDVNIKGTLNGIAAVLPSMMARKSGHILNVSSVAGHNVFPGATVYSSTKAAVCALSEGLRKEVKPYHLRTTVISPGAVKTEIINDLTGPSAQQAQDIMKHASLDPISFAQCVGFAISQPEDVDVNEIICRPTKETF